MYILSEVIFMLFAFVHTYFFNFTRELRSPKGEAGSPILPQGGYKASPCVRHPPFIVCHLLIQCNQRHYAKEGFKGNHWFPLCKTLLLEKGHMVK
jgi:hypothetical protein